MRIREMTHWPCLTPEELGWSPAAPTRVLRQGQWVISRIRMEFFLSILLLPGIALAHPHHDHRPASAAGYVPSKLEPEKSASGWSRKALLPAAEDILNESPALLALPDGRAGVAWVRFDGEAHREKIMLRWLAPAGTWSDELTLFEGPRAWMPRLAKGADGRAWAVWCGTDKFPDRGEHERGVYLRRLLPELGPVEKVSTGGGRHCDPSLSVRADGSFLVAWEYSDLKRTESRIAWRFFGADGKPQGPQMLGKAGRLDRRPVTATVGDSWLLAWDRWMDRTPTRSDDPDYDVLGLVLDAKGRAGAEQLWVGGPGIQAAPSLASIDEQSVALLFHSSQRQSLVKHTEVALLRKEAKGIVVKSPKALSNPWAETDSRGVQQGSEFPDAIFHPRKGLLWTSRPSQGFFLHRLEGGSVHTWDLTTGDWSARGLHAAVAWAPSGELLIARRAARQVVVERISVPDLAKTGSIGAEWRTSPRKGESPPQPASKSRSPIRVPGSSELRLYYGDVHMHSAISDGAGTPDEVIARAYVRGLDFATLTDHDSVGGSRMLPSEYAEIAWLTDHFGHLEKFTTLHAYEWTTKLLPEGAGHRNIYFKSYGPTEVYSKGSGYGDTQKLWGALRTEKAFAVPHHTTWTGTDWENHDEALQRHVEVASVHGVADEPQGPISSRGAMEGMYAVDGLKRGLRFGFIAGTDGHGLIYHHGIARHRDPWAHAVTGVLAKNATREQLWQAMYDRHTFGTSGPRSQVYLRVGKDAWQGDRVVGALPWRVQFEARMTSPITEAAVFRNGEKWKTLEFKPGSTELRGALEVPPAEGSSAETSVFLRVTEKLPNGRLEAAWTSPVFLSP